MCKKRVASTVCGVLLLAALAAVCLLAMLAADAARKTEATEEPLVHEVDLYRNQGLDPGLTLAETPEEITDEKVVFADRAMLRCGWTEEDTEDYLAMLRAFLEKLPREGLRTYAMTVPLRIGFEEPFSTDADYLALVSEERSALRELEEQMLSGVEDLAAPIPLMDVLERHQEEYIFYRTISAWTARGAYYGAQEFLGAAGLETFPLEAFQESARNNTTGDLLILLDEALKDRQYFYLYENDNPLVDLLDTGEQELMISLLRSGTGAFLGGGAVVCRLDGRAENGRVLLIMGGENGSVLVPWMVTSFQEILFVNVVNYSTGDTDFWPLLDRYGVTDLLVVSDGEPVTVKHMERFFRDLTALAPG